MMVKLTYSTCMLASVMIFAGCYRLGANSEDKVLYRTITAEPFRDTAAARKANAEGLVYLADGRLDLAEREFSRALAADVDFGPAHNNLGKVYFKQKDMYKAAWEFEYACKQMPKQAAPRNNLGLIMEEASELDKAADYYRQAAALDCNNMEYTGNLARSLIRRGDRTAEVRGLLKKILCKDKRPEWLAWAGRQLAIVDKT